ncbi:putative ribonuclease h protein [Senna tora]|uniref:Putative ribonuclease h protein n=1 Tax=Senna tora TaxID=362788 RepID=A0A834THB2_9FABA|nr:putative ribonuclease h protein [Senna tora]
MLTKVPFLLKIICTEESELVRQSVLFAEAIVKPLSIHSAPTILQWTESNANSLTVKSLGVSHGAYFIFGIWEIWKARNTLIFENKAFDRILVGKKARYQVIEYTHLILQVSQPTYINQILIRWKASSNGWWKLNNGSCQGDPKLIVGGGVIRDSNENWVQGFAKFVGAENSPMAELWVIIESLKMAWQLQCSKLIVETNCIAVVKLINSDQLEYKLADIGNIHLGFLFLEHEEHNLTNDDEMKRRREPTAQGRTDHTTCSSKRFDSNPQKQFLAVRWRRHRRDAAAERVESGGE